MRLNDIFKNGALPIVIPTIIYLLFTEKFFKWSLITEYIFFSTAANRL